MKSFRWVVEEGKIAEFSRGIGDFAPERFGPDAIAPPTFPTVGLNYWNRGDRSELGIDFDPKRVLHGGQSYEYTRPLRTGDVLTGTTLQPEIVTKEGSRGGTMRIAVVETVFTDGTGTEVARSNATVIETAQVAGAPVSSGGKPEETDTSGALVHGPVDLKDFMVYCAVSGDYNPIHWWETYARDAGYPSPFGVGMLTMAIAGRAVTETHGAGSVKRIGVRFTGLVWPGDTLVARLSAEGTLEVTNSRGRPVLTGSAQLF